MTQTDITDLLDRTRHSNGFLGITETLALADRGNVIYDPYSTLIARDAEIGSGNVFYPNTRLETRSGASLSLGNENVLYSGTVICAADGPIAITDRNVLGDGSILITTHRDNARISLGSDTRLRGFIEIDGQCSLGDGCQILGHISAIDVTLAAGRSHRHPVADERGAVLKGSGRASKLELATGEVIAGDGQFDRANIRTQSFYHPTQVR